MRLVAERAPGQRDFSGDEALAELTRRFFRSHGPATIRDFVWWSGLATSAARRGLDIIARKAQDLDGCTYYRTSGSSIVRRTAAAAVHLLPIYDEYLVSYRDRVLVPHGPSKIAAVPGHTVTFQHALVIDGRVAGTWRMTRTARALAIAVTPLRRLTAVERSGDCRRGIALRAIPAVPGRDPIQLTAHHFMTRKNRTWSCAPRWCTRCTQNSRSPSTGGLTVTVANGMCCQSAPLNWYAP